MHEIDLKDTWASGRVKKLLKVFNLLTPIFSIGNYGLFIPIQFLISIYYAAMDTFRISYGGEDCTSGRYLAHVAVLLG